ncbi:hypothetical protein Tco_0698845 [Tanacetum coccineum]
MSQPANDEFSQHLSDDEESNHEDASDTGAAPKQQQQSTLPVMLRDQCCCKERKAKNILLMAIPKEHMRRFHGMDDAKEIWEAIRTRFGGNANSKKMQKAVFKQQFEAFKISNSEGLEKGYDRFQQLLSQLEAHGAEVSTEDANHSFSDFAPSMVFQSGNDIRELIQRLKLYLFKSSTNKVKSGFTGAYSTCTPSTSSTNIPEKEVLASFADEVIYSLFAKQSEDWDLLHEDLEQINDVDIEEMDINWQIAMIAIRMKKFYKKTGRRVRVDGKTPVGFDKKKLECFNCHNTGHFARNYYKGDNQCKEEERLTMTLKVQMKLVKQDDSVTGTKIPINPVPVAMKVPSIATYKIIKQGEKGVFTKMLGEDGTVIVYGMDGPEDELENVFWKYLKKWFEELLIRILQGGKPDEDCYKMLKMMEKQAGAKDLSCKAEQTALGKDFSNPALKNSCCKDKKRRLEVLQIKNNLKNSIYNILRKLKVFKVKIKNVLKELEVHNTKLGLANSNSYLRDILGDILGKDMYYPLTFVKPIRVSLVYKRNPKAQWKFTFLADFVVVDYDVDPRIPLILRRPFLRTTCTLVDVYGEELILRDKAEKLIFHAESTSRLPHKHGNESINMINFIDITCEDRFDEVLKIQKSIHCLSGSPTPSDLVVESLSPSPIPCMDSDSLMEETDILLSHFNDSSPDYKTFCLPLLILIFLFLRELTILFEENISDTLTKDLKIHELNDFPLFLSDCESIFSEKFSEIDLLVLFPSGKKTKFSITINGVHSKRFSILLLDDFSPILFVKDFLFLSNPSEIDTFLSSFPFKNEDKVFDPEILLNN